MNDLLTWAMFAAWGTAVITDLIHSRALMVGVEILLVPIGIIRGLLMWFGVV